MSRPSVVFFFNLPQDVNVLRPLIHVAAREVDADIRFLLSPRFKERDDLGGWRHEVAGIAQHVGADVEAFPSAADAYLLLQGGHGILIAGSESDLPAHREVHEAFRGAPPGYLRVTLQHGLECVGLSQNRDHDIWYGRNVTFAADVVCAWTTKGKLPTLVPSQRPKVMVTGPTSLLQRPKRGADHPPTDGGLVCENLHSVRMRATGAHGRPFMDTFDRFCDVLCAAGETVTLRPHPGGQYVLKHKVALPPNVVLNNLPMNRVDLGAYAYGISAPSTVILDMALAGIPVGVWQDPDGLLDVTVYDGLERVSTLEDWVGFVRDARVRPDAILSRQRRWLEGLGMPLDPAEVYRRYTRLLANAAALREPAPMTTPARAAARPNAPRRILFLATGLLPTLQISFLKPLAGLVADGRLTTLTLTLDDMKAELSPERLPGLEERWLLGRIDGFAPDLVVACRYNGPGSEALTEHLAAKGVPLIFAIDDDLLDVPSEIGAKAKQYRDPARRASLTHLLEHSDLVYVSTPVLRYRLRGQGIRTPMVTAGIFCAAEVVTPSALRPVTRIGYMGSRTHAHDLRTALSGLVQCLEANPEVSFDLFGPIPMPPELSAFGDRVRAVPPVGDYSGFMGELSRLDWDIGICPLADSAFNKTKNNNKWIEYTAVGAAVVATAGLIYDDCGSDGCALLVGADGWSDALQALIDDPARRHAQVLRAQDRLRERYSEARLTQQVLSLFDTVANLPRRVAARPRPSPGQQASSRVAEAAT